MSPWITTPASSLSLGSSFERAVRIKDGRNLRLRWIQPTDAHILREGFARLSMESRVMRFFAPLHKLSDDMVRYLTEVDGINHAALIAVSRSAEGADVRDKGYGIARFIRSANDPRRAEVAVTVTDETQGHGLGRRLVETLAVGAHALGIDTFEMIVLASNWRVRSTLRRIHADYQRRDGEVVEYSVPTASFLDEARTRDVA